MFLFDIGIEHESDTSAQKLVNSTVYASAKDVNNWRARVLSSKLAVVATDQFKTDLITIDSGAVGRNMDMIMPYIKGGIAGFAEFEKLRVSSPEGKERTERYDNATSKTFLCVMAIFKCYEENWAEPLKLVLKDKKTYPKELQECILQWLINTDKVKLGMAMKERNIGLVADMLEYYSNAKPTQDSRMTYSKEGWMFHEIVDLCYDKSMREPLQQYLDKDIKRYPDFQLAVTQTLEKMGPVIEKDKESVMRQIKKKSETALAEKKAEKNTVKR